MKAVLLLFLSLASTPAWAEPPAPTPSPDPELTLRLTELQALINLGIAQTMAQGAQARIKAQMDRASPSPAP